MNKDTRNMKLVFRAMYLLVLYGLGMVLAMAWPQNSVWYEADWNGTTYFAMSIFSILVACWIVKMRTKMVEDKWAADIMAMIFWIGAGTIMGSHYSIVEYFQLQYREGPQNPLIVVIVIFIAWLFYKAYNGYNSSPIPSTTEQ